MKLTAREWQEFFAGSEWAGLCEEWEQWKKDIYAELMKIGNPPEVDTCLKGNMQLIERVLATPHYLMQDFEDELEKAEREEEDGKER